ncbi:mitochondrial cruciform cutting endonuclease 1, partial [Cladorrhinum samala]
MSKKPKTTTTFSSLTNAALRNLCSLCGLPKTGTKPLIRHRLQLAAHTYQPIPRNARILSIDLGLRNFAFSLISPNPSLPSSPSTSPSLLQACTSLTSLPTSLPNVTLHAWDRLDLIPSVPASFAFSSPASMASLTHSLVTDYLLPLKPTHILIERQRYRSSNQLPIQEWTVRVNTLEAMLHATFRALAPPAEAQVASVTPKLVASYMFPNSSTAETYDYDGVPAVGNRAQRAYRLLKKNKVKMLGRWLAGDQQMIRPGNKDMQKMLGFFVEAFESKGKRRGRKKKKLVGVQAEEQEGEEVMDVREMVGKLDDLSDSVLQGMVWIQWNRNLERLIDE